MKYKDEVPKQQQITLDKFSLLPGDRVCMKYRNTFYNGRVKEVGSANPEYVLGGPDAPDAGVMRWTESERTACAAFLYGGHLPVKIRLKKSMWAVIELIEHEKIEHLLEKPIMVTLYTYDIVKRCHEKTLILYLA